MFDTIVERKIHMSVVPRLGGIAFKPVIMFSLLVSCCDVVRVYFHRVRHGKNPFLPDKNHIHHKLLAMGLPQRVAMIMIVTVSLLFTVVNVWLSKFLDVTLIFVIDLVVWTLGNIWLSKQIAKRSC